jgi:lysyl-tRNA synthetase class 2
MRVPLQSTLLASALYHQILHRLEIEFHSGERYLYIGVPPACYQQFLQADSKGSFFNRHIRNRFPFQHLSDPSAPVVLAAPSKN